MTASTRARLFRLFALPLCLVLPGVAHDAAAAQLRSLQNGTVTLSGGLPLVVTLPVAVDPTRAFVVFGTSESTADPLDGHVSGQLTSGTTVTFQQSGGTASVTVKYYVAEFTSGVLVQRGNVVNNSGNVFDVPLGTTVDTTRSFPLVSFRSEGVNFNCNDFVRARLTSGANLQLTADVSCGPVGASVVEWQVVEYQDAVVQSGDVTFAATDGSLGVSLPPATATGKSWLIYSYEVSPVSISDVGQYLVRGRLTDLPAARTLTFDRSNTGTVGLTLTWYLVEFTDDTFVQSGSQAFQAADTVADVALSLPAPLAASIALGGGDYHRGGSSSYSANDVAGVGWFNFDVTSSNNLRITRGAGGLAPADVGWFVVRFPAPSTAVELMSFEARGTPSAVQLSWRTGSELDNLGFHLHRSTSEKGPWTRITPSLIAGLGSSPLGASYAYLDEGLLAGRRYHYRLEDVDTHAVSTFHGPVSAVPTPVTVPPPVASAGQPRAAQAPAPACPAWVWTAYGESAPAADASAMRCTRHGDPEKVSLEVTPGISEASVELRTGGFYAVRDASGAVHAFVPGFDFPSEPSAAALPLRRVLVDAPVGRRARIAAVEATDWTSDAALVPAVLGRHEMAVGRDGSVRATRRPVGRAARRGGMRRAMAHLAGVSFLGETKAVTLELSPLRFDRAHQAIRLARRLRVRLAFTGVEAGEKGHGFRGRRPRAHGGHGGTSPGTAASGETLARLFTTARGLHAVTFESLFPAGRRPIPVSSLRLQRAGDAVPLHVEPARSSFGPGGVVYFFAPDTAAATDYAGEIAYELLVATGGLAMASRAAAPSGPDTAGAPSSVASFEANRYYQPGLLDATDLWQWDSVPAGVVRTKPFTLAGVDPSSTGALTVFLQGASESGRVADHHVRAAVNGVEVGEVTFAGKLPSTLAAGVPPGLLREGANELTLRNVGDTGVFSTVLLDRFSVEYPRSASVAEPFEGRWGAAGAATVGVPGTPAVVDVTGAPQWLTGFTTTGSSVRFQVEAGHRYVVASREGLLAPRVALPLPTTLRDTANQADWVLIVPRAFLAAAHPLVERRASQGLAVKVATLEEIASAFGAGAPSARSIRDFLSFAYQSWRRPSPRYVLLLGGASQDPRNFTGTSRLSPLPYALERTSFLWTGSDPALAAVNGDDAVPDLALGRLPAHTVAEAETLVAKLLDWEDSGQGLDGNAVLVADNPDPGGNFDADADDIVRSFLVGRETEVLKLSRLGPATRPAVLDAWNRGASLTSYVGHGAAAVWASEALLTSFDVPGLLAQPRQPLLFTLNCLNGYFLAPNYDSLAEALVKAAGRGAIASVSPSGLSIDGPAHVFHRALMAEFTGEGHPRLGDAFLAAQAAYARSGQMPELLRIYALFGDPAMPVR